MIDMLKPAREIVAELNRLEHKVSRILIHGIGRIKNVTYGEFKWDGIDRYGWKFTIELNDEIQLHCLTRTLKKDNDKNPLYFEEGEKIEFFGMLYTHWSCGYGASEILLLDAKLANEERYFTEVFMWNIEVSQEIGRVREIKRKLTLAYTRNEKKELVDEILCTNDLEETENKWSYGHLVKKGKKVILQLDKVME